MRPALLFVLGAALATIGIRQGIGPHDEGLMLQAGARLSSGQWIYRDFWLNYPPGQPLVLALLQDVFGASLLAWRVVRVLVDAGVAVLAYSIVRQRGVGGWRALLCWLAVAGAMAWPSLPVPNPPALLLAFAGVLCALRGRVVLAGVLAGLAVCFRIEIGVAAVVAVVVLAPDETGVRWRALAAGVAAAVVPLVPFFVVAPGAMWHDLAGFISIQSLQRLPFPLSYSGSLKPDKLLEFYLPLVLVVGCAVWAVRSGVAPARWALAWAPLVLVSLLYLLARTDEFHLVPLSAALPVALAVPAGEQMPRYTRVLLRSLGAAAVVVTALIALYGLDRQGELLIHPLHGATVPGPAADGVQTTTADARALARLRAAVDARTTKNQPIFVADPRHDRLTAGDPLLYVILGHPNPTRYDVMQPGLVTTATVQREIVRELAHTNLVIRWLDPRAEQDAPDTHGSHILDDYLASAFHPVARYGVYELAVR